MLQMKTKKIGVNYLSDRTHDSVLCKMFFVNRSSYISHRNLKTYFQTIILTLQLVCL